MDTQKIDIIKNLGAEDSITRMQAVESIQNEILSSELCEMVASLLPDPDKGVRNSAAVTIALNPTPELASYVVKYISSEDISVRNLAGDTLLKLSDKAVDPLLEYLKGRNDDDIKFIVDILGLIGNPKIGFPVLELLKVNTNSNVILACIEALGNVKYKDATEVLIPFYHKDEVYKATVAETLGKIGSQEALDFLVLMYDKEDELTKFSIIESLGIIGNESTYFFLISELGKNKGTIVGPLLNSLYLLKSRYNFDIPYDEKFRNVIMYVMTEGNPQYRKSAIHLLPHFDDKEIIYACLKIYGEDQELDEIIRPKLFENSKFIYHKVSDLINETPVNLLSLLNLTKEMLIFDFSRDNDFLSNIDLRNIIDSLSNCLDSADEEVRRVAIELLFGIDVDTALLFVDKVLNDNNMWNRLKLLEITENIFVPGIDNILKQLLEDPEEMIRERAQFLIDERKNFQLTQN